MRKTQNDYCFRLGMGTNVIHFGGNLMKHFNEKLYFAWRKPSLFLRPVRPSKSYWKRRTIVISLTTGLQCVEAKIRIKSEELGKNK